MSTDTLWVVGTAQSAARPHLRHRWRSAYRGRSSSAIELVAGGCPQVLGANDLRLGRFIFGVGDGTLLLQVVELGQLVSGRGSRRLLDVIVHRLLLTLHRLSLVFVHLAPPGDYVDEDAEEGHEDDEDEPERLMDTAQIRTTEKVDHYLEEDEEPEDQEEEVEDLKKTSRTGNDEASMEGFLSIGQRRVALQSQEFGEWIESQALGWAAHDTLEAMW